MILFVEMTVNPGYLGLYTQNKEKISSKNISILGNESKKLIGEVKKFLLENNCNFDKINNIIIINGPGSFTGIRSICLYFNTISYLYPHIFLTGLSFFDTFDKYPIIKSSSRRDLFVKKEKNDIIYVISNEEFENYAKENNFQEIYGFFPYESYFNIKDNRDFDIIIKNISLKNNKNIAPLYIKKPNIS